MRQKELNITNQKTKKHRYQARTQTPELPPQIKPLYYPEINLQEFEHRMRKNNQESNQKTTDTTK